MELAMLLILLLLQLQAPSMVAQNDSFHYEACAPSRCGNITVSFPFSTSETFCSPPGFEVSCDHSTSIPTLTLASIPFTVKRIYINIEAYFITLTDTVLVQTLKSNRCNDLQSHVLPAANFTPFHLAYWTTTLNLALCRATAGTNVSNATLRYDGCGGNPSIYILPSDGRDDEPLQSLPAACSRASLPVQRPNLLQVNLSKLEDVLLVLNGGFPLQWQNFTDCWDCQAAGGHCGFNRSTQKVLCFCGDGDCVVGRQLKLNRPSDSWKIIIGTVIPTVVILLVGVIVFVKFRAKALSIFGSFSAARSLSRTDSVDVKEFIKTYRSTWTIEFSYKELKKNTDGFKHKLGSGGFGNVYKGKLATGQFIAVKVLEKSSGNGRDFINEVATIGMIRHANIIKLLGYCCDDPHRALVYEFMPQGSLADLLSRKEDKNMLGAQKLFEIAIAVAQGIEYLHQGCDKRILHLDIKPQNVLLDSNLQPKISDFGLAKFYSKKDSVVPLTGARGTVGYIAPEVFMRNLGGASHKSDVYSYGMLLLEMIVGRTNCNSEHKTGETEEEEAYFPDWIYDQMNKWADMVELDESVVDFDISVSRKMVMVGLWCIQVNPVDRPSISTAIGMLTGRLESIAMPPKPLLIFPPKKEMSLSVEACVSGGDLSLMSVGLSEITER